MHLRTRRFAHRTRSHVVRVAALCAFLALSAGACGASGSSDEAGTTTTETSTGTGATPAKEDCDIPAAPTDELDMSVQEPWEDDAYESGSLTTQVTYASGDVRCHELSLDGDASVGWAVDSNDIELVYGDDETTVTLTTLGEPMAGPMDAEIDIDGPDGSETLALDTPFECGILLAQMDEGTVEGWIDCADTSGDVITGVEGHFTATG